MPFHRGKRVTRICLDKLIGCIQNTVSSKSLGGLIEERRINDGWEIAASKVLVKAVVTDTFTWSTIQTGELAAKHAAAGRKFKTLDGCNDMGKVELLNNCMDLLVRAQVRILTAFSPPLSPSYLDLCFKD